MTAGSRGAEMPARNSVVASAFRRKSSAGRSLPAEAGSHTLEFFTGTE
jgi:hypothetical protein